MVVGFLNQEGSVSVLGWEDAPEKPAFAYLLRSGGNVEIAGDVLVGLAQKGLVTLRDESGPGFTVKLTEAGKLAANSIDASETERRVAAHIHRAHARSWINAAILAAIPLLAFGLILVNWRRFDAIDSFAYVCIELAAVVLVSFIKVPGHWADAFPLALLGSIPALARIGLAVWLVVLLAYCLALIYLGSDLPGSIAASARFISNHPSLALLFGPTLTIAAYATSPRGQ